MGKMEIRKSPNEPVKLISTAFLVNLPTALKLNTRLLLTINFRNTSYYILLKTELLKQQQNITCCLLRFSIPKQIYSDQDPAFESRLIKYFL